MARLVDPAETRRRRHGPRPIGSAGTPLAEGVTGPRRPEPEPVLSTAQNHLIERLPDTDRLRLLAVCELVELRLGEVLCERGDALNQVYFPVDGCIALVMQIDQHPSLEVGLVGREGLMGAPILLGVPTAMERGLVQGPGAAWRVPVAAFQCELARSTALQGLVARFLYVRMSQLAGAAACQRFHLVGPRLARWLLMSQDRAHGQQFHVTHEFLASMLGVRRVGVTAAAGVLQRAGLIHYRRGELTVLDRAGLERAACSCYAADSATYRALLV